MQTCTWQHQTFPLDLRDAIECDPRRHERADAERAHVRFTHDPAFDVQVVPVAQLFQELQVGFGAARFLVESGPYFDLELASSGTILRYLTADTTAEGFTGEARTFLIHTLYHRALRGAALPQWWGTRGEFDVQPEVTTFNVRQFESRIAHEMLAAIVEDYAHMGQTSRQHDDDAHPDVCSAELLRAAAPRWLATDRARGLDSTYEFFLVDGVLFPWVSSFPDRSTVFILDKPRKAIVVLAFAQGND